MIITAHDNLAASLFLVTDVQASRAVPAPAATQPSQPTALPPPEGDFYSAHTVSEYDATSGDDIEHEMSDVVTIKKAANGALNVKLNTVGRNFSECFLDATMASSGPNEWRWTAAPTESDCIVVLKQTKTEIDINPSDACSYYCGVGAYLGATFPVSSRRPVGTYEWTER